MSSNQTVIYVLKLFNLCVLGAVFWVLEIVHKPYLFRISSHIYLLDSLAWWKEFIMHLTTIINENSDIRCLNAFGKIFTLMVDCFISIYLRLISYNNAFVDVLIISQIISQTNATLFLKKLSIFANELFWCSNNPLKRFELM